MPVNAGSGSNLMVCIQCRREYCSGKLLLLLFLYKVLFHLNSRSTPFSWWWYRWNWPSDAIVPSGSLATNAGINVGPLVWGIGRLVKLFATGGGVYCNYIYAGVHPEFTQLTIYPCALNSLYRRCCLPVFRSRSSPGCTRKPFEVMPNNSGDPDTTALSSQKDWGVVGGGLHRRWGGGGGANPSLLFSIIDGIMHWYTGIWF